MPRYFITFGRLEESPISLFIGFNIQFKVVPGHIHHVTEMTRLYHTQYTDNQAGRSNFRTGLRTDKSEIINYTKSTKKDTIFHKIYHTV
jgi:hypothetical protein